MTQHRLEVADVFREYGQAYLEAFGDATSTEQRRVLHDLVRCRTAALGGHVEECDHCGHRLIAYNSCRNRHCPKCQAAARARWMEERAKELLPVEYFHVVFTLPDEIGSLALQNGRVVYNLLFRSAAESLLEIAADPQHLGANIGFLAVLHTWGQNLHLHPHVHCVVPGGGISWDGTRWIGSRPGFFLPVRVLRRLFRGRYLALLNTAFQQGQLKFHGQQCRFADPNAFAALVEGVRQKEWVVYAKPPFGGPRQVLKYLARYTHRVAISNQRLLKIEDGKVHFHWKDYARENAKKIMAVDAVEFMRRFLLHVVPSGFVRIRHFGFLANRHRKEKLQLCRSLLGVTADAADPGSDQRATESMEAADTESQHRCPECKRGHMVVMEAIPRQRETSSCPEPASSQPVLSDTS
jgi:Putative transposase/Transposase zinc-binding domain